MPSAEVRRQRDCADEDSAACVSATTLELYAALHLNDFGRTSDLGLTHEQVNMFRHHDVSDDYETISFPDLFENCKETVAATRGVQKWQSAITGPGDKVQVMSAVSAM